MKVGDVAGPVKSQFGYHILKLEEIQAGRSEAIRRGARRARFAVPPGSRRGAVRRAPGTDRRRAREGRRRTSTSSRRISASRAVRLPNSCAAAAREPLGSSVDLQQTVFSDATLNQGKIGGPVALGEDRLVLVKVTAHHKAAVKPLERGARRDRCAAQAGARRRGGQGRRRGGARQARRRARSSTRWRRRWTVTAEPARFVSRGDPSIPGGAAHGDVRSAAPDGQAGRQDGHAR